MRSVKTRVAAIAAAAVFAFALVACGGTAGTESSTSTSEEEKTEIVASEGATAQEGNVSEEAPKELTAGEALEALKGANEHVTDVIVWDEETDLNDLLGRPGQYVSKADFSDDRVDEMWTDESQKMELGLSGGTMETFSSESDCAKRCKYLQALMGSDLGAIGVNQYVYKYPKAIFRVSYDIVPSEAEVYKAQMDVIMGVESETIAAEE